MGQARGGAVTAAVISATLPVVGIALEVARDGRKLTAALILGLVLSLVGGMMALDFRAGGLSLGLGAALCFCSVLAFALGSRPVSYTHLDVYKRQGLWLRRIDQVQGSARLIPL